MAEYYQAYKTVDGQEVEWIDPLVSFKFADGVFFICNEAYGYEQPIEDLKLWNVRRVTK